MFHQIDEGISCPEFIDGARIVYENLFIDGSIVNTWNSWAYVSCVESQERCILVPCAEEIFAESILMWHMESALNAVSQK